MRPGVRCTTSALVCTSCTRGAQENGANRFGRTPNCRESRINHMFGNTFPMRQLNNTPKPRRPGVRCTTSAFDCTSCGRGAQENGAISLVVLQTAEILGLIICFAIHFLCVTIE